MYRYLTANEALMNVSDTAQSIIITGISGSGKTESTKHMIDFLCYGSDGAFNNNIIMSANPILEAFGNAKTPENVNSSRFCKLLEVISKTIRLYLFFKFLSLPSAGSL